MVDRDTASDYLADERAALDGPVARFFGGPLDGRYHPLRSPARGQTVTHVYLHGGPKIETRYRLDTDEAGNWVFYLVD